MLCALSCADNRSSQVEIFLKKPLKFISPTELQAPCFLKSKPTPCSSRWGPEACLSWKLLGDVGGVIPHDTLSAARHWKTPSNFPSLLLALFDDPFPWMLSYLCFLACSYS